MSARTYALARRDDQAQLIVVEADITEGLPNTDLRSVVLPPTLAGLVVQDQEPILDRRPTGDE